MATIVTLHCRASGGALFTIDVPFPAVKVLAARAEVNRLMLVPTVRCKITLTGSGSARRARRMNVPTITHR